MPFLARLCSPLSCGACTHVALILLPCPPSSLSSLPRSWDRQVFVYDGDGNGGSPTVIKQFDEIAYNWILANYHSSMAIDNDDGSAYYETHDNVFIAAPSGAAYGGNSLKSDFGGHDK